jgi:hypothetical protein
LIDVRGVTSNGVDARGRLSFAGKATAISDIVKAAIFRLAGYEHIDIDARSSLPVGPDAWWE